MTDLPTAVPSGAAPSGAPAALDALRRYFGYDSFRPGQTAVVNALLSGRDVLAVMPTGAGKSVCYQIPAVLLPGVTVVVSPLISLMQDQVDALNDNGIPAAFVNGMQAPDEQSMVLARAAAGRVKLLYVAPERLETQRFKNFSSSTPISLVAVDEAHCVSQWGQDFRSSYLSIGEFITSLPRRPIVGAFTATATEKVRYDVVNLLGLRAPQVTVTGFDRPNLYFDVLMMGDRRKAAWIVDYVAAHPDESGIVYCATRRQTEALADTLNKAIPARNGASVAGASGGGGTNARIAVAYHGGMKADVRAAAQRDFVTDRVQVVVATNAFGMGIDKSNVRYVIHHNMPESIEAYYQEAGRAGRDGEPSRCTLLWNESDIVTRRRLLDTDNENERMTPEEQEIARRNRRRLLDGMIGYCRTTECLHRYMTRYFGQEDGPAAGTSASAGASAGPGAGNGAAAPPKCGACANCERTFTTVDVTEVARSISRCVHDVDQRVGSGKIVKILRGSQAQELAWLNPQGMPTFGALKDESEARIRDVLSQMATDGFLYIDSGRLPIVKFGRRAAETVAPGFHYEIKRVDRKSERAGRSGGAGGTGPSRGIRRIRSRAGVPGSTVYGSAGTTGPLDADATVPGEDEEALFERLRALRRTIAQEIGKPPYIVFSDRTLRDMARIKPVTDAQFLAVNGVGERKLDQYGKRFMETIAAFGAGS